MLGCCAAAAGVTLAALLPPLAASCPCPAQRPPASASVCLHAPRRPSPAAAPHRPARGRAPPPSLRRLFESVTPLLPDVVGRLSADIAPFCSVGGLRFGAGDAGSGPWRNFFVGLVGAVAADEDDILWPNQVQLLLHAAGKAAAPHCPACGAGMRCSFRWALRRARVLSISTPQTLSAQRTLRR